MKSLTGAQRKYLRGLAHGLDPVVHLGKAGLTEAVVRSVDRALTDHELIKIRFVEHKEERRELASELARCLESALAGVIGHVAILYRPHPDPERRKIQLSG